MPISTPAVTSVDVVHAAQHPRPDHEERDRDDERPRATTCRARFSIRDASTSSSPPNSATEAAVWPDGKLASTGRPSSRSTSGRSRWTTSVVARYVPDSTQITNSVNAASRQCRESEEHDEQDADEDGDHDPARERRADPREIDERRRPLAGEPVADALVRTPRAPSIFEQDPGQQEAERRSSARQERVAAEDGGEEDADGMLGADGVGEPLRQPARGGLEQRRPERRRRRAIAARRRESSPARPAASFPGGRRRLPSLSFTRCVRVGKHVDRRCPSSSSSSSRSPPASPCSSRRCGTRPRRARRRRRRQQRDEQLGEEAVRHPWLARLLRGRLDPGTATGLALTARARDRHRRRHRCSARSPT